MLATGQCGTQSCRGSQRDGRHDQRDDKPQLSDGDGAARPKRSDQYAGAGQLRPERARRGADDEAHEGEKRCEHGIEGEAGLAEVVAVDQVGDGLGVDFHPGAGAGLQPVERDIGRGVAVLMGQVRADQQDAPGDPGIR